MTNPLLKALEKRENITRTENGAKTYKSTMSDVLDFFGTCGAIRNRSDSDVIKMFSKAFAEHPLYAIRTLFYCRDIRGGQGERKVPRTIINWLAEVHPNELQKNILHIPFYGRWDDLFGLRGTRLETDLINYISAQLKRDINSLRIKDGSISLLGKWMPSENTNSKKTKELARWFMKKLELSPKRYRKMLVSLRKRINIVETKMCKKDWKNIDFSTIPSRASMIYRNAFKKHNPEGYEKYLNSVEKGETKINTSALYPYDLVRIAKDGYDRTIDLQWKNLPDYIPEGENSIVVADTSGSMTWNGNPLPIDICLSIAIYFAERNVGPWHNRFITFSQKPTLQRIVGSTLSEKCQNLAKAEWNQNTNLQAVFDLILNTARANKVSENDMLKKIYIISDMEFDHATTRNVWEGHNETNFEAIKQKYATYGYKMPTLVFWNVQARNDQQPITVDDRGVYLVSGCSPSIFESIMQSKTITPLDLMLEVLDKPRYAQITV